MTDWWHEKNWRLIQTNLREIDMIDISAQRIVQNLHEFKANVLMINAAGIIASYPTDLPFHFQSPYLKGDSLGDIIAACHAAGIRVIARTDFSKVRRAIFEANPGWAYRTPDGQIVDYNGDVHVCINGGYQQDYALKIIEELLSRLAFDGIFFNMGGFQTRDYSGNQYGPCHCAACRQGFTEMFGAALPRSEPEDDPVWRHYAAFKKRIVRAHHEKVYHFIQSIRPDLCIANHTEFGRGFIRQESNTAIDRPLPHWQYSASENTKWASGSYPGMVSSNTTVDFIDYPYRHVAVSPHQQQLRLVQSLANGGTLDYYLIGRLDNHEDRSGFSGIKSIFHYHAANEQAYANLRPVADVALLSGGGNVNEFRGWFRFLVESHQLFDVVKIDAALDVPLEGYRAIIVPDLHAISDELAGRIDGYVADGGTAIVTGRSGWQDEAGGPRQEMALLCTGVGRIKDVRTATRSTYFKVEDRTLFPRLAETGLIYMEGPYVHAGYASAARPHLRLIPPHNFGPPERCYYSEVTDEPGFVVHPHGKGTAIYIPWLPGALFHRQGHLNTFYFAADLLEQVAGLGSVGGNLPAQVEVTRLQKTDGGGEIVHLVNGSGHFGVSFHAPITMRDLEMSIPRPQPAGRVRSLPGNCNVEHAWRDGILTIRIPRLGLFEAVWIE